MDYTKQAEKTILLKDHSVHKQIYINSIIYIECDSYLTTIHLCTKEKITIIKTLKDLEVELHGYGFMRVNHNVLINLKYIISIVKDNESKRQIELAGNKIINVSRRKWPLLKQKLFVD